MCFLRLLGEQPATIQLIRDVKKPGPFALGSEALLGHRDPSGSPLAHSPYLCGHS